MGSIFPTNTDQVNFCSKISVPLTCILNGIVLIFCCAISSTARSLDLTMDCDNELILISPNYPEQYPNDASKKWNITAPSQRRILVTFNDFNLENINDAIVIQDMVNSFDVKRYTGENIIFPPFLTQGHNLQIKFSSSDTGRRKGFNISVTCYEAAAGTFQGRLMDGMSPAEGFLELSSKSGEWKRVCEENLSSTVANIICRELGSPFADEITYFNDTCLVEEKCTRAPRCQDNTYRLVDCAQEHSVCTSNTSVKVKCREVGYKGCYDFGSQQLKDGSFFKSKEHCISSCRKDDIGAIAIMNPSECFCSTADEVMLEDMSPKSDNECTSISTSLSKMKVYLSYIGFCDELDEPANGFWDSNITWFGSIVHLTCMEGYNLSGNGTLQCAPISIPYYPEWNDSMPSCVMKEGSTTPTTDTMPIIVGVISGFVILVIVASVVAACWKWRKKLYSGKGGFRQSRGQTWDERRSIDLRSRGRAVTTDSRRTPDGPATDIAARRSSGQSRPSTSNSTAPISVISSVLPDNVFRLSRPTQALPAPPVPSSHHSNAPGRPFRLLHHINPQRQNHYISSNNEANPYYYASSSDNQRAGSTRLEEAYHEPSTVSIMNHAYEGTADQAQSLENIDNTNVCYYASSPVTPSVASSSATSPEGTYQEPSTVNISNDAYEGIDDQGQSSENLGNTDTHYYASSSVTPRVPTTSATNPEETYQKPSTTKMADNAYKGTTVDQMHSNTSLGNMLRFGLSMISRPLPHRPSSSNCNDGPSLPPRKSSRGSRQEPSASASLRQRKPVMVNENNNIALGACSPDCNVRQNVQKKDPSLHKRTRQAETPLYHTLEKDEQQHRGHEQDNLDTLTPIRLKGDMQDPLYYCLENNNDSCTDSGIIQFLHDVPVSTNTQNRTDVTDSSGMIDNVLYTPMPSKPRNTKLSN